MKKALVLAFGLLFMIFIMSARRRTIAKFILIILPFSIQSLYGQLNTYMIVGVCGYYLFSDAIKGKKQANLSGSVYVFFILFIIANGLSFIINYGYFRFDEGMLKSTHVQAIFILISCLFLFAFIAGEINSQEDVYEFLTVMVFAYLLSSCFAIIQIINPAYMRYVENLIPSQDIADTLERGMRVYGTLGTYELFAEYSGIVFLSSCCMALNSQEPRRKIIWLCVVLTSIFMLFMTKSRGPIVSLLVCTSYLIIFNNRVFGVKNIFLFLLSGVVSIGLAYIALKDSKYNVIDGLLKTNIDVSAGKFDSRSEVWKSGYDTFLSMDFINQLFGVGPGTQSHTAFMHEYPHNIYLYLLISLGLFGSALSLFWFLWVGFSRQGKFLPDKNTQLIMAFFKAIIVFFVVDQIKIEYTRVANYQQIMWAYFALIYIQVHKLAVVKPDSALNLKQYNKP